MAYFYLHQLDEYAGASGNIAHINIVSFCLRILFDNMLYKCKHVLKLLQFITSKYI